MIRDEVKAELGRYYTCVPCAAVRISLTVNGSP